VNGNKLSLSLFLMLLTLSIGLVSANFPLLVNAQNSVLSQNGNDNDAKLETNQEQYSNQDGQVVSGDSSIVSGNSLLCQTMDNIDTESVSNIACNDEEVTGSPFLTSVDVTTIPEIGDVNSPTMMLTVKDSNGNVVFEGKSDEYHFIHFFNPNPVAGTLTITGAYTNGTAITKDILSVEGTILSNDPRPMSCSIIERNTFECIGQSGKVGDTVNNQIRVSVTSN
jgi:hypothetical protein